MKKVLLILFVLASIAKQSMGQTGIITTVAGTGTQGYSGDSGQATSAEIGQPIGVVVDLIGNIYISDASRIRKINTVGIITTFAGNGIGGSTGDGGQCIAAEIGTPYELTFDHIGNLYIPDGANSQIRKVNTLGVITTIAGNGTLGYSGDGAAATAATLSQPTKVVIDATGNLYVADNLNNAIRKINTAGIISTFAGNGIAGYSGDGGQATAAELSSPYGLVIDAMGNLFISDNFNNVIRKVNTSGIITTVVGSFAGGYSGDGGQATAAELSLPTTVTFDAAGNLYIADSGNFRVRKVATSGIINTIAGSGTNGFSGDGGQATTAWLSNTPEIALDALGNLYIGDGNNFRIRKVCFNSCSAAGIQQLSGSNNQINIYPNPATTILQVSFSGNSENSALVMTDVLGNTVKQTSFNTQHLSLNINDIEAGVYFITVTSGTSVSTQKVVVSK
jgi:hypothetical protein